MKHLLFVVFLFLSSICSGQGYVVTEDKPFSVPRDKDSSVYGPVSRVRAFETLSEPEREYLYWVNRMRVNPPRFFADYIVPFLKQFPEAESSESRSLAVDMKEVIQLPLVFPSAALNLAAASHAAYLSTSGSIGHIGKGGKDFPERMREAGISSCAGEVIFSGKDDVLMGLILLLIDHRVPGLGHRKALLNPSFSKTGVGLRYTKDGKAILVQNFSCN